MIECVVCKGRGKLYPTKASEEDIDAACELIKKGATCEDAFANRGLKYDTAIKHHVVGDPPNRPHWALKLDAARLDRLFEVIEIGDRAAAEKNMAGVKWAECKLFGFDKARRWRKDKQELSAMPQVVIIQGDAAEVRELFTRAAEEGGGGEAVMNLTVAEGT